jgi:hypothetical protein
MTKLKLLSAALIAAAMLATPAMARTSHVTSRHFAEHANATLPPPPIIKALSAFERRASAHFLRRPRTGKIATSAITRLYAEKAAQRNASLLSPPKQTIPRTFLSRKSEIIKTVADQLQKPSPRALPANARCDRGCDGDDC